MRDKGGEERTVGESTVSRTQLLGIPGLSGWEVALSSQDAFAAGNKETALIREWNKQSKREGSGGGSTGSCYNKFGVALNTDPSHDGLGSHSILQPTPSHRALKWTNMKKINKKNKGTPGKIPPSEVAMRIYLSFVLKTA